MIKIWILTVTVVAGSSFQSFSVATDNKKDCFAYAQVAVKDIKFVNAFCTEGYAPKSVSKGFLK